MFVDTVNMKIKACNAFNAMFVDTGVCIDSVNITSFFALCLQ